MVRGVAGAAYTFRVAASSQWRIRRRHAKDRSWRSHSCAHSRGAGSRVDVDCEDDDLSLLIRWRRPSNPDVGNPAAKPSAKGDDERKDQQDERADPERPSGILKRFPSGSQGQNARTDQRPEQQRPTGTRERWFALRGHVGSALFSPSPILVGPSRRGACDGPAERHSTQAAIRRLESDRRRAVVSCGALSPLSSTSRPSESFSCPSTTSPCRYISAPCGRC